MVCFFSRFWAQCYCIWCCRMFIGNDLILSCSYVKYFMDFNTKRGICSAFGVLNL